MIFNSNLQNNSLCILAPAKLNLHLEILGIRNDGYHELAMVMQSIDLMDKVIVSNNNNSRLTLDINFSNLDNGEDNLIIKAAKLLKRYCGNKELGADIKLEKNIPIGAGLAGGSTDAAATLVGLNKLWNLGYSKKTLETICSEIGSDIPFCVSGGTQICFGKGEILEPVDTSKTSMSAILVKDPEVSVSTPWAYSLSKQYNLKDYLSTESQFNNQRNILRSADWLHPFRTSSPPPLRNDLQKVVAPRVTSVEIALEILKSIPGALSVAMSGSGPSCFALFPDLKLAQDALKQNRSKFDKYGFDAWCCSFINNGVCIQK